MLLEDGARALRTDASITDPAPGAGSSLSPVDVAPVTGCVGMRPGTSAAIMGSMPDSHSSQDDRSDPDDLSVVFSAAPAPEAEDAAPADAAALTGWPWFLPQDGLRHEDLVHAVDEDPRDAAESLARIALVRRAVTLLEHIGSGRPLTSEGELDPADVRALAVAMDLDLDEQEPVSMREIGAIVGPWNSLIAGKWLSVSGGEVVPGEGMVPAAARSEDPAAFVRFARAVIVLLVLESLGQGGEEGGLFGGSDTFTALLHTVAPDGLLLPATIRIALDQGLVPADPAGDPDMDEINRYWQAERDLGTLAAYGLLHREPLPDGQAVRYLGTVEVLVEAYGALEMFEELD